MSDDRNDTPRLDPRRTALLVMDYQPGIIGRLDDPEPLLARANEAIATLRGGGDDRRPGRLHRRRLRRDAGGLADGAGEADATRGDARRLAGHPGRGAGRASGGRHRRPQDQGRRLRDHRHDRDYRLFVLADASADPRADVHEALIGKVLPLQAEVIEVADLERLLG